MKTRLLLLMALTALLSACSSGFDKKWQAAARRPAVDPYSGRWVGEWKSTRGTHHGQLECIFTKQAVPTRNPYAVAPLRAKELRWADYSADFHAHWHGLSSSYTVPFWTVPTRGRLHFRGEQDLGVLQGGVYKYDGFVTPATFRVNYDSRYDTGVFELHRVPPAR